MRHPAAATTTSCRTWRTICGMTGRCLGELERILRRSFQVEADAACSSNELECRRRVNTGKIQPPLTLENARRAAVSMRTAARAS
jgi:hypothetical protein